MQLVRFGNDVVAWAPAKVNLFLEVQGKRPDGYHEIATLIVAVRLFDTLVFEDNPTGKISLECTRKDLSTGPDNLIVRAAELLKRKTNCASGASIRLVKRIPMQAGLAGGSTNAAATLAALNTIWKLGLADGELAKIGSEIGSDVPFFFHVPTAWCTGRGEKVTPVRLGRPLDFVVVCPPVGLATAEVYRRVRVPDQSKTGDEIRRVVEEGDIEAVGRHLHNRLQTPAEELSPAVAEVRKRLTALNPAGVLMSGSGSSVFALCRNRNEARRIAQELKRGTEAGRLGKVFVTRSY